MTRAATFRSIDQIPGAYGTEQFNGLQLFVAGAVSDHILLSAYSVLSADNLLESIFFEGVPSAVEFLQWVRAPTSRYAIGFCRPTLDSDRVEIAGIGLVWDIFDHGGVAMGECGMCFRRKYQFAEVPAELADKMVGYAFQRLGLDVLAGCTPVINRPAIRFIEKVGFKRSHVLEKYRMCAGRQTDCLVSVLFKQDWERS